MNYVKCPEYGCGVPSEILRRTDLESTSGDITHAKIQCISEDRHNFTMPLNTLVIVGEVDIDTAFKEITANLDSEQ